MRRVKSTRLCRVDLLARPPSTARSPDGDWVRLVIDPVDQLRELAELHRGGLLSVDEYERQRMKVLEA